MLDKFDYDYKPSVKKTTRYCAQCHNWDHNPARCSGCKTNFGKLHFEEKRNHNPDLSYPLIKNSARHKRSAALRGAIA